MLSFELDNVHIMEILLNEFRNSLTQQAPPTNLRVHAKALWYDAKDDWKTAHELIQDISDEDAAWIHAYLHRKEGDLWNADYWYSKANRKRPAVSLEQEWEAIVEAMLK